MAIKTLLLAMIGFALWVNTAFAAQVRITARNGVNFRSAGGADIGGIPAGAVVNVDRVAGNWVYVTYNGRQGKIYRRYTAAAGDSTTTVTRTTGQTDNGRQVSVTVNGLNFRSESGSVIGTIPRGTVVTVERQSGNWLYVNYNGRRGKIYKPYTATASGDGDTTTTRTTATATATEDDDTNNSDAGFVAPPTGGGRSRFDTTLSSTCSRGRSCRNGQAYTKYFNPSRADSGECGDVLVNCGSHRITMTGVNLPAREQVINCGKYNKTKDGIGTVGGTTGGRRVPHAVNINMRGMGTPAGGKWFHIPWWSPGGYPSGVNSSRGCIHVSPLVMALLKRCQGSRLRIINSYGPNNPSGRDTDEGEAIGNY